MKTMTGALRLPNVTFVGLSIAAGAMWRRHLRNIAHSLSGRVEDISFENLASLRFPHLLSPRSPQLSDPSREY